MKSLLTFELGKDHDELFIHGNAAGLRYLASRLMRLADKGDSGQQDHDHLMTEEWAGRELSSKVQGANTKLLNHVKVYVQPDQKNGI